MLAERFSLRTSKKLCQLKEIISVLAALLQIKDNCMSLEIAGKIYTMILVRNSLYVMQKSNPFNL